MACFFYSIILRLLLYANTAFSPLSPLVSTCLFSESRVHVSGEEWALSWGRRVFRQEEQMYRSQRTVPWNGGWRGRVGHCLRVCCCYEQEICWSQWVQCFHSWSFATMLALKWGPCGVKIITKQISSVAAVSSISLISCFFPPCPTWAALKAPLLFL